MPIPPTIEQPSSLGLALWRIVAACLYALALLLIPHDLPAALFTLVAALLCLPGTRVALHRRSGVRLSGVLSAAGATALMFGAVLSAGTQLSPLTIPAGAEVVVASAQVAKP